MKKRSKTTAKSSKILHVYNITLYTIVQNFIEILLNFGPSIVSFESNHADTS